MTLDSRGYGAVGLLLTELLGINLLAVLVTGLLRKRHMKKLKPKPYDAHVLVCHGSKCSKRGAPKVKAGLQKTLKSEGHVVRVSRTTCQGFCKHGCVVALEGKNVKPKWWGEVAPEETDALSRKIAKRLS